MTPTLCKTATFIFALLGLAAGAMAQSQDLGNGFIQHGVATPISNHRGTVATIDGEGRPVVLSWIMDHRGSYALLLIDATTGQTEEFPVPWRGDSPFASILSTGNRYYTHCGSWFAEFDPVARNFSFMEKTAPQMAMSMTEDDNGVIWSASYPQSGIVSYDPQTGRFRDYGHLDPQDWAPYPRSIAGDDQGWIDFGIGSMRCQIIILDPESGAATAVVPEQDRVHGSGTVTRCASGRVYGQAAGPWYELYHGTATRIERPPTLKAKPYIAGSQGLFHQRFPNGDRLVDLDLVNRRLTVATAEGGRRQIEFDYSSEGAHRMGLAAAPDGTICGGTAFPMRFFRYDPQTDQWTNRDARVIGPGYGQWNTVAATRNRFFVGGYTGGYLLEWDPARSWVQTEEGNPDGNPRLLAEASPHINRPHDLLAHPDGRHVILAGTPGYGRTGGGLLFWDRQTEKATLLTHDDILPWHSTMALVAVPDGKLLGGTTIAAGTGGQTKATEAELYILDMDTKRVEWHGAVMQGARSYVDMIAGPDGLVFGFADSRRFFVFDTARRALVHEVDAAEQFGPTTGQQGPRIFVQAPDGRIFILFRRGIAQLDPKTYQIEMLAESPIGIGPGGDWLDGRIDFASGPAFTVGGCPKMHRPKAIGNESGCQRQREPRIGGRRRHT